MMTWAELVKFQGRWPRFVKKADFDIDRILEIEQGDRRNVSVAFTRTVSETLGEEPGE